MFSKIKKQSEGFTIIEVLIVLAIAGLIMLIVFLAVPALQRNSRNTQIRNSAAAVLGGINDFVSNNNGLQPTGCSVSGNTVSITGGPTTNAAEAKVQGGYTVTCSAGAAMPAVAGAIAINLGTKCSGNAFGSATARAYSAGFLIESSGAAPVPQCVES